MNAKIPVFIYSNAAELSLRLRPELERLLSENGFEIADTYSDETALVICVGGDGTFLHCVQNLEFPDCPILGINTGHLGFFQEVMPDEIGTFIHKFTSANYSLQRVTPIKAIIHSSSGVHEHLCLNEVIIRGPFTHITHIKVELDGNLIQEFSGDGILFATPVGSTAYNYALGGSIVAPNIDVFQMTPIAPSSTNAYRCFRSSIMYAAERTVRLFPTGRSAHDRLTVAYDGLSSEYDDISMVEIQKADSTINIIRFEDYNYWSKLTAKLL